MYIDFMTSNHRKTSRNYLKRVNDKKFPKYKAATLSKKWSYDYWDGDRRINYGGYHYQPGRWKRTAERLIHHYKIKSNDNILDIGCGKGFLLYEIKLINPKINVFGFDISSYALKNAKIEIKHNLIKGCASNLPYKSKQFKLAISLNTLHCLKPSLLEKALIEISRVSKRQYICVESFRNEYEKMNLLYWQTTCEAFYSPESWKWWFRHAKYKGDHSFIYFN
tara:strand:+ start:1375 stop:2040 length:666 start_codon:yes stop_codon:yes gene_type:complete